VAHHNDGNLAFFDCHQDDALTGPIKVVVTPEVNPGTRSSDIPNCCPSVHHVTYSPNGNYLLASDSSKQGRVWTYAVNEKGIPANHDGDIPTSFLKVTFVSPPPGWMAYLLSKFLFGMNYRIRRAVLHPNGKYVYLLMEFNAVLQVYEIDKNGKIYGDCLQEIPTIDPDYWSSKWTGVGMSAAAELYATETEVLLSNRGMKSRVGSAESSIRIFGMEEAGARLVPKQLLETSGPVRHFWMNDDSTKLYSGVTMGTPQVIETFVRSQSGVPFEKVGEANVEMDVLCIACK
jgi:6-phosphogluconolactonase (cycloisomerase 2 family)